MFYRIALSAILAATALQFAHAAELPLSIAQVEKVTGRTGLTTKPAKYDKLGTNFVTANDQTIITVKVATAEIYNVWKSQPAMSDQVSLSGVGEDAVYSKIGQYICFKKASQGICVVGMLTLPGKPAPVNEAQLKELAILAAH